MQQPFAERLLWAVAANEGSAASINWDDVGQGISIGIRQWNQRAGEMPEFMQALWSQFPELFRSLLPQLLAKLQNDGMNFQALRDISKYKFTGDDGKPTALGQEMQQALLNPQVQEFQTAQARIWVAGAMETAKEAGFKSEYGVACIADAMNQAGPNAVKNALRKQQDNFQSLLEQGDEEEAIERLEALIKRPGGTARDVRIKNAGLLPSRMV